MLQKHLRHSGHFGASDPSLLRQPRFKNDAAMRRQKLTFVKGKASKASLDTGAL